MQNFGRGMWRRVGDFERINVPQIIKQSQIEQEMIYKEYISKINLQKLIDEHHLKTLEKFNKTNENPNNLIPQKEEIDYQPSVKEIVAVEQEIPMKIAYEKNPIFLPKKGRKKV